MSGALALMNPIAPMVISASPMPISAWVPSMAGSPIPMSVVPERPSCSVVSPAAAITESHAANPTPTN